jgi:hypothetical protein
MPRIAVVTPYHREPLEMLVRCHESVIAQQPLADHIMVADGFARPEVASWNVSHVTLPREHGDYGCTARGVGSMLADVEGYDFVAYLDADNWFLPGHLASLIELQRQTGAPVCTSFRAFHGPGGESLDITEPQEDSLVHVDTNCFLIGRAAFGAFPAWLRMPRQVASMCDRVFLAALLKERFAIASTRKRTIAYRTLHELHYMKAGLEPPTGAKPMTLLKPAYDWLLTKEGVDQSVTRLGFWPLSYMQMP